MIFKKTFLYFFISLLIMNLNAQPSKDYAYSIGAKDLIDINVFEVPELNITVRVSEDGSINLPLLGKINVAGLNRFQLENRLVNLLEKKYLKNAQVTVFIKEYESKKVSVMGAVKNPGSHELIGRQTLLQLIAQAGGLTGDAADRIIVIRQYDKGKSASLMIDLEDLMVNGNPKLNIPLQTDDIINIPLERHADIFIFGQVNKPGNIKMKKSSPMTLLRAIVQAGGFTERARKSNVIITRKLNGKDIKIHVNVKKILSGKKADFPLMPNDIVYVKQSIL